MRLDCAGGRRHSQDIKMVRRLRAAQYDLDVHAVGHLDSHQLP